MAKITKIEEVDKYMKADNTNDSSIIYYNPKEDNNFKVLGLAFFEKEHKYFRLPTKCKDKVSEAVYWLASQPSGGQIRFKTNAKKIVVKMKNKGDYTMCHMAKTGQQGVDLYYRLKGQKGYTFYTCSKFNVPDIEFESTIFESDDEEIKDIIINLPLYEGIEYILIGINKNAIIYPNKYKDKGRVVVYGTSITQGGCASRPGMSYTNILSRKLKYEFINLGFSGSGLGENEMAKIINTISNVKMLILDYDANGGATGDMYNNLEPFIDTFKSKHKKTPIIVISKTPFSVDELNNEATAKRYKLFRFQRDVVRERRMVRKDKYIYFIDGNTLLGNKDIYECSVDGIHLTDLGFYRMANNLYKELKEIFKINEECNNKHKKR